MRPRKARARTRHWELQTSASKAWLPPVALNKQSLPQRERNNSAHHVEMRFAELIISQSPPPEPAVSKIARNKHNTTDPVAPSPSFRPKNRVFFTVFVTVQSIDGPCCAERNCAQNNCAIVEESSTQLCPRPVSQHSIWARRPVAMFFCQSMGALEVAA